MKQNIRDRRSSTFSAVATSTYIIFKLATLLVRNDAVVQFSHLRHTQQGRIQVFQNAQILKSRNNIKSLL